MSEEEKFGGFVPPVSNFFKMPNEWINICSRINSLAELKVVQYVLRHTWGWHEYDGKPKKITLDEFMHGRKRDDGTRMDNGTGLSKPSVIDGIEKAIKDGYLICEVNDNDPARIKKSYKLNMHRSDDQKAKSDDQESESRGKDSLHQDDKNRGKGSLHPGGKGSLRPGGKDTRHRSEKDNKRHSVRQSPTDLPSISLSSEEQNFHDLWNQKPFNVTEPTVTPTRKTHYAVLAPHVRTKEQLTSLFTFAKEYDHVPVDKPVELGNLVRSLNGWLQVRQPAVSSKPAKPPIPERSLYERFVTSIDKKG